MSWAHQALLLPSSLRHPVIPWAKAHLQLQQLPVLKSFLELTVHSLNRGLGVKLPCLCFSLFVHWHFCENSSINHSAHKRKAFTQDNSEPTASKRKCSPLRWWENTTQFTPSTPWCELKGTKEPFWRSSLQHSCSQSKNQPFASGDPGKTLPNQSQQTQTNYQPDKRHK